MRIDRLPDIGTIAVRWILVAGLMGIALQLYETLEENLGDEAYYTRHFIAGAAQKLVAGARIQDGKLISADDAAVRPYRGKRADAYAFRILDRAHNVLAESNGDELAAISPLNAQLAVWPDSWQRKTGPGWFEVAGGIRQKVGAQDLWIEILTHGDPELHRLNALLAEIMLDVLAPLAPTLGLTMLVGVIAVRRKLRPLTDAAERVRGMEGRHDMAPLEVAGLPREAAVFVNAINQLIARVQSILAMQERLFACAAHELRSRLSILLLEAGKLPGGLARQIEADIAGMANTIQNLLTLARLDAATEVRQHIEPIDLDAIARAVVSELRPLAEKRDVRLSCVSNAPERFTGNRISIMQAVRNLIENAIKHGPEKNTVTVTCGEGRSITVDDNGPGLNGDDPRRLFEPFARGNTQAEGSGLGLTVAKAAVDLHTGSIETGSSPLGGARFVLRFNSLDPTPATKDLAE